MTNPSFKQVESKYSQLIRAPWEQQLRLFWDFLFAVGYNHPKETNRTTEPMPKCPKDVYTCDDPCEKNKWNVLPLKERMDWYIRFWTYLPDVLPGEIKDHWIRVEKHNPIQVHSRKAILEWLWKMRCGLDAHFKLSLIHI